MKHKIISVLLITALLTVSSTAKADEYTEQPEMKKMYTTAYCQGETTYTGVKVRYGIVAAKKEWIGKTVLLYEIMEDGKPGELYGIFEILDTGGARGIKNGKVIDVYFPTLEECQEWMERTGGRAYVQFTDAKG